MKDKSLLLASLFQGVSSVLSLYIFWWYNHFLTTSDYADFNVAQSVLAPIILLSTLGLPTLLLKFYTKNQDLSDRKEYFATIFWLRILLSIFFFIISAVLVCGMQLNPVATLGFYPAVSLLLVDQLFSGVYGATKRSWLFGLSTLLAKIIGVSGLVLYAIGYFNSFPSLVYLIIYYGIGYFITILIDFWWNRHLTAIRKPNWKLIKPIIQQGFVISIAAVVITLYQNTLQIYLQKLGAGAEQINIFSNVFYLVMQASGIAWVIVPQISSTLYDRLKENKYKIQSVLKYLVIVGLGLGIYYIGLVLALNFGAKLIFANKNIEQIIAITPIAALYIVFNTFSGIFYNLTILFEHTRKHLWNSLTTFVISIPIYIWLITNYGIIGAAIGFGIVSFIEAFTIRLPTLMRAIRSSNDLSTEPR